MLTACGRARQDAHRPAHGVREAASIVLQRAGQQPRRVRPPTRRSRKQTRDPQPRRRPERPRHQRADLLLPRRIEALHRRRGHRPAEPAPGLGHLPAERATRSASSRPRRSASSRRRTRPAPTTPRTTAAASCPTGASSRPTSATRRRARRRPAHRVVPAVQQRPKVRVLQDRRRHRDRRAASASTTKNRVYVASGPSADRRRVCGTPDRSRRPTPPTAAAARRTAPARRMADAVQKELFIAVGNGLAAPIAIVPAPTDDFYVSSVITGVINEYDANGAFVRTILQPPAGETLGAKPFSTGTPLGLGVGPDGTLYYADIGIVITSEGIGPGPRPARSAGSGSSTASRSRPRPWARGLAVPRRHRRVRAEEGGARRAAIEVIGTMRRTGLRRWEVSTKSFPTADRSGLDQRAARRGRVGLRAHRSGPARAACQHAVEPGVRAGGRAAPRGVRSPAVRACARRRPYTR